MSLWDIYKAKKIDRSSGSLFDMLLGKTSKEPHRWIADSVPYILRKAANGADILPICYDKIVGGSVVWNQLVADSGSDLSVTIPSGHKYYMVKSGTKSVGSSSGTAITGLTGGADIVIDLTVMFGSTIADHIYSLESGTSGAGVTWLNNNGFFSETYYSYSAESLKSISGLQSRETMGKNLLPMSLAFIKSLNTSGTWNGNVYTNKNVTFTLTDDGAGNVTNIKVSGKASADSELYIVNTEGGFSLDNGTYKMNGCPSGGKSSTYRLQTRYNGAWANNDYGSGSTFTYNAGGGGVDLCRIQILNGYEANNLNFKPMIRSSAITDASYEPYAKHVYLLDSTLTLRGIPKLDANNSLYYDGDVYNSNGTVKRKYGIRTYQSGDVTDGSTMVTDGVNTIYKLESFITETADSYTNPQSVYKDGTEKYVIESDVAAMPVGHITKYKTRISA